MKWYSKLYIGKGMEKTPEQVRKELAAGRTLPGLYLLCLPSNPQEQMDIVPAYVFTQTKETLREWEILGLAQGKQEAMALAGVILKEVYEKTGVFDVRAFTEGQME